MDKRKSKKKKRARVAMITRSSEYHRDPSK